MTNDPGELEALSRLEPILLQLKALEQKLLVDKRVWDVRRRQDCVINEESLRRIAAQEIEHIERVTLSHFEVEDRDYLITCLERTLRAVFQAEQEKKP